MHTLSNLPSSGASTLFRGKFALLGLLGILLMGGIGYGTYHYFNLGPGHLVRIAHRSTETPGAATASTSTTSHQSVQLTATPTADPYAAWKTFKGTNFTLRYPAGWYTAQDVGATTAGDSTILTSEKNQYSFRLSANGIFVSIAVSPITGADVYNQIFASRLGVVTLIGAFDPKNVYTKIASTQIAANPSVEYVVDYSDNPQGNLNEDVVYVIKKGANYQSIAFSINKSHMATHSSTIQQMIYSLTFTH